MMPLATVLPFAGEVMVAVGPLAVPPALLDPPGMMVTWTLPSRIRLPSRGLAVKARISA
jgi:hypothetical protein